MRRSIFSPTLIVCGVLLVLFGASAGGTTGTAVAQQRPQPSPRPALASTSEPSSHKLTAPANTGHVTGTVIDLVTGAPIPGVNVAIGNDIVVSDVNGNYDHWVPAGTYTVSLVMAPERGVAVDPVQVANVETGNRTVIHLNFRSPVAAVAPPAAAAAAPMAPTVAPKPAPSTGMPARLPRTGVDATGGGWLWVLLGIILIAGGGALGVRRGPTLAAVARKRLNQRLSNGESSALLKVLLVNKQARTSSDDTAMLEDLLKD